MTGHRWPRLYALCRRLDKLAEDRRKTRARRRVEFDDALRLYALSRRLDKARRRAELDDALDQLGCLPDDEAGL